MAADVVDLATQQMTEGRFAQAEAALRRLLQRAGVPREAEACALLAMILGDQGQPEQALFFLERAIRVRPDDPLLHLARAERLLEAPATTNGVGGRGGGGGGEAKERALAHVARARELAPESAEVLGRIGNLLAVMGRVDEAEATLLRALELNPGEVIALTAHADLLLASGRPEEAYRASQRTARATAETPEAYLHQATVATFANYTGEPTREQVFADHAAVGRLLGAPAKARESRVVGGMGAASDVPAPMRVAFISPDLLTHSVSYFAEPLIRELDRSRFAVHGYFLSRRSDSTTARLRRLCQGWRDLPAPSEAQIADLLRRDGIHVAIDLAGLSANSGVYALRNRVAPVQATYIGYPNTTGIGGVEFRLVDSLTDPATDGADQLATERLVRLDSLAREGDGRRGCFLCYAPPEDAPDPALWPDRDGSGPIVFGSFNLLGKLSASTRALWARIVLAVPGARLLLKSAIFEHESARALTRRQFANLGVPADRLDLHAQTKSRADHLAMYRGVDVGLDPFPYNGTTTTCEALWMGVPVVVLAGDRHAARVGVSLLSAAGVPELIAPDGETYLRRAVELAEDAARRAAYRRTLRPMLRASALCDQPGFARRFEAALVAMWASRGA